MGVREAFQCEWQSASAAYVAGDLDAESSTR